MISPRRRTFWFTVISGACLVLVLQLCAQTTAVTSTQPPGGNVLVKANNAPAAPVLKSPVEMFRQLLAMKPDQRERSLAGRSTADRKSILEKIQKYEDMKPGERDSTLSATEIHWYLEQLIENPAGNPASRLAAVPEAYRQIVGERLDAWTILPPPLQKKFMEHEKTREYFLGSSLPGNDGPAAGPTESIPPLPPPLAQFAELPPEERDEKVASFQRFIELPAADRRVILDSLPDTQRQQVERTLQALEQLPRDQRDQSLLSITKLAGMTEAQRLEFFKNVARWKALPPAEQDAWRDLVNRLPPMPPGLGPPMPPMPPPLPPLPEPLATNNTP